MRILLLVVCLTGLTLAEDRPFVRISHPADAAVLPPDTDFDVRGVLDQQDVEDASKFQVQFRLYQGVVSRLNLVQKATAEIEKDSDDARVYRFRTRLHLPAGGADAVLRVEVFQTAPDGQKWVARDLVVIYAGQPNPVAPAETGEHRSDTSPRDRRVVRIHDRDGERYDEGSNISTNGKHSPDRLPGSGKVASTASSLLCRQWEAGDLRASHAQTGAGRPPAGASVHARLSTQAEASWGGLHASSRRDRSGAARRVSTPGRPSS